MPPWLFEGNPTLYFVFAAAGLLFLAAWWRTRKRRYAVGAAVAFGLVAGVYLLDQNVESDREQLVRHMEDIAAGVRARDFDRVFKNVSDTFRRGSRDKRQFREYAETQSHARNVTEFTAW